MKMKRFVIPVLFCFCSWDHFPYLIKNKNITMPLKKKSRFTPLKTTMYSGMIQYRQKSRNH